jgi:TolB protein
MFGKRRLAALIGVCAAGVIAAAGVSAGAAAAQPRTEAQARVPWASVGTGWVLAEYTNGTPAKHGATTLYLVSPRGTRYALYTWRASANVAPQVLSWSGDKTRALFSTGTDGGQAQLDLRTGKLTRFRLTGQATAIGYTMPDGLNILGIRFTGTGATLARYSLTGKLVKVLIGDAAVNSWAYSANGATLAVSGTKGPRLVSNAGGVIRQLRVPGTDPSMGCMPVRWWNAGTILAMCYARGSYIARLWLVPAGGGKPAALTPQRKPSGPDYGDLDAWRLTSGLYLQSAGACGTLEFNKQAANGSIAPVKVPGTLNVSTRLVTALGPRLLIEAITGCGGSQSLLWFNPGTKAEQWLFKTPGDAMGVQGVVAYNSLENAP